MKIVKVIKRINQGGFGIIDEVLCDDGNHYARKQFFASDQFKADSELCERLKIRFIREVKTQKILPSDYFIPILFDDLNASNPYFIMPLADDVYTNEISRSKSESRNPEGLGDILNALEFLHDKGLVHRDLKPQNILKHNGAWKLADFGLISQDKEILSQTITTSKHAFGTAMYCAPEQVVEFNRITPQADIYSFGAILHDIFTDGNRVPYSELGGTGEIGQIIAKCTRHKKEQRFKNIKSIRTKLLTLLSGDHKTSINQSDLEWQTKFDNVLNWDEDTLENFVFYLKQSPTIGDFVFNNFTEENLQAIHLLNRELFNELALIYLDWVYQKTFNFDYCDVVVNNVYFIYQHTKDVEVKSKCSISAAELGKSHNRWYVMRYVIKMSDVDIDDNLAFRIGMDIELDERNKMNFKRCAAGINLTVSSYHKLVKEALA
jgi:serine/threonine protein kinase